MVLKCHNVQVQMNMKIYCEKKQMAIFFASPMDICDAVHIDVNPSYLFVKTVLNY